jgi:DNA-binding CsgD family transcriptional regulator
LPFENRSVQPGSGSPSCASYGPASSSIKLDDLKTREREILSLICRGAGEISEKLKLSPHTNHVASLKKLGVNRASAVVIWARERGMDGVAAKLRKVEND